MLFLTVVGYVFAVVFGLVYFLIDLRGLSWVYMMMVFQIWLVWGLGLWIHCLRFVFIWWGGLVLLILLGFDFSGVCSYIVCLCI